MNIRNRLPLWLQALLPFIGYQRLSRKEVLDLKLCRFDKWEGFFVGWPADETGKLEKGRMLWVRRVKETTKPPTNPPLAPA